MESKFMTRNGALIRIRERGGQKYVRLCELAQGLGYRQYNVAGLLKQIIDAVGLSVEKDGVGRYEMELGQVTWRRHLRHSCKSGNTWTR